MAATPIPSNISFKIRGKESYFRFSLPNAEDIFQKLLDALKEREIPFLKLFWIDEEGDRIVLRNQADMKDALAFGKELIRLEAELQPEVLIQEAPQAEHSSPNVRVQTPAEDFVILDSTNNGREERHRRRRDRVLSRSRTLPYGGYVQQPAFYNLSSYPPYNDCHLCNH